MADKINWVPIRDEYITTDTTYRELAKKYSVSPTAVYNKGKKEQWVERKREHLSNVQALVERQVAKKIAVSEVDRLTRLLSVSDRVLEIIEKTVEQIISSSKNGCADTYKLRQIVQSIKDLKDIQIDKNADESKQITVKHMMPRGENDTN